MTAQRKNVIPFPREVLADEKVRRCQKMVQMLLRHIEEGERNPNDRDALLRAAIAPPMLEMWRDDLKKVLVERELVNAGDAIRYRGLIYRAQPSQNGAH